MLKKAKKGQSLIEYGLVIALVAVIAIAVMKSLGAQMQRMGQASVDKMDAAATDIETFSVADIKPTGGR